MCGYLHVKHRVLTLKLLLGEVKRVSFNKCKKASNCVALGIAIVKMLLICCRRRFLISFF